MLIRIKQLAGTRRNRQSGITPFFTEVKSFIHPHDAHPPPGKVGIFDSGLGGLSVLRALRLSLPDLSMIYVADSAFAPYGERSAAEVCDRSHRIAQSLIDDGAGMLVVACNTATAAAIPMLRARWPDLPIIGVEPGLKPALRVSHSGRIGVMATEGTLRSERFQALMQREVAAAERLLQRPIQVHLQPCPGLAAAIETADLDDPELRALVAHWSEPMRRAEVDTVVLGCTHYPFVAGLIQEALGGGVQLIDTADAVAQQAARRWATDVQSKSAAGDHPRPVAARSMPTVSYRSSGELQRLRRAVTEWLGELQPDLKRAGDLTAPAAEHLPGLQARAGPEPHVT